MFIRLLTLAAAVATLSPSSLYAASEGSIDMDYGMISFKGKNGGKSITIQSFRFSAFDTTGMLTAGIRGALNQNAAQKAKEAQIDNAVKNGGTAPDGATVNRFGNSYQANYSYSWDQPAPTPTDGDKWMLTLATNGTPFLDAISPPTSSDKNVESILGVEYSSTLWSLVSAPVSLAAGWGMKFFLFSAEGPQTNGGGLDTSSFSVPLNISASTQIYEGIVLYGDFAVSPVSLFKGKGIYMHEELGVQWKFAEDWLLNTSYRLTQDAVSEKDSKGDPIEYEMNMAYVGIGLQL